MGTPAFQATPARTRQRAWWGLSDYRLYGSRGEGQPENRPFLWIRRAVIGSLRHAPRKIPTFRIGSGRPDQPCSAELPRTGFLHHCLLGHASENESMSKLLYWNRLSILAAATRPSSADF